MPLYILKLPITVYIWDVQHDNEKVTREKQMNILILSHSYIGCFVAKKPKIY